MTRQRDTLVERLTDLRAERRRITYRAERGLKITKHHKNALDLLDRKIEQYEADLHALGKPRVAYYHKRSPW